MDSKRIELCDSDTEKIMELSDDMIFYIKGEKEMLRLCANGDIFVKEHLVENKNSFKAKKSLFQRKRNLVGKFGC